MEQEEQRAAADQLRALLDLIDRGEIDATSVERAYLAGAADALGFAD